MKETKEKKEKKGKSESNMEKKEKNNHKKEKKENKEKKEKTYDTEKEKMCAYSQSDHAVPHWKCVLRCCAQYPRIYITDQETNDKHPNPSPSTHFHIYHLISRCTKHGRLPLSDKKSFRDCQQDTASVKSTKIYTRKELVIMETTISNFHISFLILEIHELEFHIPRVQILRVF